MWGPYSKFKKFNFNFQFIKNDILNYKNETFDLITCFLSLHHTKNMKKILNEIYRILKPNGLFVIIEHDILNDYDLLSVNIEHTLYDCITDKNTKCITDPVYSLYYNKMEFQYILTTQHKFKIIHSETYYESINMAKRYDNQFFQIYKK